MQAKTAHSGVKSAKGLIQQQQARLRGQRSGERHALPLPAGQLRGPPAAHMGQLYEVQQLPHPAQPTLIGTAPAALPGLPHQQGLLWLSKVQAGIQFGREPKASQRTAILQCARPWNLKALRGTAERHCGRRCVGMRISPAVYVNLHLAYRWTKGNVLGAGHVLEERIALEDKANLPLLCWDPCSILIYTVQDTCLSLPL